MTELSEVVITAPDPEWLRDFTRSLVADRLASSVHNFTPVQSTYRWQGEIHDRTEGRASLHTRRALISEIVQRASDLHPYQVPGISARPIHDGNPEYLQWIENATRDPAEAG
ncbi:divalent-cation tolerance protein CutA [Pseudonocardia sp. C8]|uniref:divalent-cation tolerance protein CutA n=1 Tax=Pseudonocardia sp. C8 TaxID=2762759 RepID=UPI00164349F8|nr:divalent-cation tolerance protein CutA [Pseudonocardia sp. C8]MBC3191464.1 divalent-cation tolerance protein CutA [Pseudonocardia sp. C8]